MAIQDSPATAAGGLKRKRASYVGSNDRKAKDYTYGTAGSFDLKMLPTPSQPDYTTLSGGDTFRVMYLQPGVNDDELEIRLQVVSRETAPEYEAISYVWGNAFEKYRIRSNIGPLHMTANLIKALRAVRCPDRESCLWADAICINQKDLLERSHQVKQMAKLFANAANVLVWPGADSEGFGRKAFDYARKLASPESCRDILDDEIPINYAMDMLNSLTCRPWFGRIWTTQELGMASKATFLCGHNEVPWNSLRIAYKALIKHGTGYFKYSPAYYRLTPLLQGWMESTGVQFLDFLGSLEVRSSSEPRYRIFALLAHPSAMIRDPDTGRASLTVEPDNQKPFWQVDSEATRQIIRCTGNLDALSHVRRENPIPYERALLPT